MKKMNLPNKLTLLRVLCIPLILVLMYFTDKVDWLRYIVALLFVGASFTDMLDGKIARKNNLVTDFGKLMDPLADKALVITVLIVLVEQGRLSATPVMLIVFRELAVTGLRAVVAASKIKKVVAASIWGKAKTVVQMITVTMLLLDNIMAIIPLPIIPIMVIAMTALTVISGVEYFVQYKECLSDY